MGQGQSRKDAYYQAIHNTSTIDFSNISPYSVLDVREDFTFDELKKAYRETAFKVHPDKGGSEALFNFVTECFKTLAEDYKLRQVEKPHHVLKQDFNEYARPTVTRTAIDTPDFNDKFNRLFEENKLQDNDNDHGYGHIMVESTKEREDFKIKRVMKKFDNDKFNNTFESVVKPSKEIIVYKEPEPLLLARNLNFTVIGGKTEDFTSDTSKEAALHYSDYYKAHTTSRLVDPRAVKKRKEYKTVGEYDSDRAVALDKPMSDEELKYLKEKEIIAQKKEDERIRRTAVRDEIAEKHYDKMNKMLLNISI